MMSVSRRFAAGLAAAALFSAPCADADLVDNPHFNIMGLVVVWAADAAGAAPVASDFVLDAGSGASAAASGDADLIAQDAHTVVTGALTTWDAAWPVGAGAPMRIRNLPGGAFNTDTNADGVMDAADAFSAFRIRQGADTRMRRADISTSFFVASNVPFWIDATATPLGATQPFHFNRMRLWLSVTLSGDDGLAFGSAAQYPNSGGPTAGVRANGRRLSTMTAGWNVFRGNQRTAALPGTLAEQSVRFDAAYRYNSGQIDLSEGVIDAEAEVVYTVYMP